MRYEELVAEQYTRGKALSTAAAFEIDDVIDPADTRAVLTDVLARVAAGALAPQVSRARSSRRSSLPETVLGSSSRNSIWRGYL